MSEILTTQKQFEENFKSHLLGFYATQVTPNRDILMIYKDCSVEGRWLEFTHTVIPGERNPADMSHGGITAWLLDTSMGMLNLCILDTGLTPTATMTVNYLEGIPVGSTLVCRAHLDRFGKRTCYDSAQMFVDGKLCATATGVYIRQPEFADSYRPGDFGLNMHK